MQVRQRLEPGCIEAQRRSDYHSDITRVVLEGTRQMFFADPLAPDLLRAERIARRALVTSSENAAADRRQHDSPRAIGDGALRDRAMESGTDLEKSAVPFFANLGEITEARRGRVRNKSEPVAIR